MAIIARFRRIHAAANNASWNNPSCTNPHLDSSLIEAERERLPARVFAQEYGGEFVEGAGQVFRYVREAATGEWLEPIPGRPYFAGLDLAKVEDFTVLVILDEDRRVVFADRFHRLDWALQVNRIVAATERFNGAEVYVDTTGAGEPVFESLMAAGCYANPYPFTQRSKAALVDNLSILLEKRLLTLPEEADAVARRHRRAGSLPVLRDRRRQRPHRGAVGLPR